MKYWNEYINHEKDIKGKKQKYDRNIYSFDIETTSYLILRGVQIPASMYLDLNEDEQKECLKQSNMYIWMFGINNQVYYGRTWDEFILFLDRLEKNVPEKKYIFVHNLSFEFQFLKSVLHFSDVTARKSHKVMSAILRDYNIIFKCSYILSNCALEYLTDLYNLPIKKLKGNLDYTLERNSKTKLSKEELEYCKNDILVIYEYIKFELGTYSDVKHIPLTSTGKVRRELKEITVKDYKYKRLVQKAIDVDPHVYNLLIQAFMGGYTHSSFAYTDVILENVDSYDECSAYPYTLVSSKFPMTSFKKLTNIKNVNQMSDQFAFLVVVRFSNLKCKYLNHFISASKCRNIYNAKYDNR